MGERPPPRSGGQGDLGLWKRAGGRIIQLLSRLAQGSSNWHGTGAQPFPTGLVLGESRSTRAPVCYWPTVSFPRSQASKTTVAIQPLPGHLGRRQ